MVFLEVGTLRNAQILQDPIKCLCVAIGLRGAIQLQREFSDGFSETRVVLGEHRSGPDDPQPFHLVFKVGGADVLRDEVRRYIEFTANARATAAFIPIWEPNLTLNALPTGETLAAIAYGYASDVFGALDCVSFKNTFRECIIGSYPEPVIAGTIESLARVMGSLYSAPTRCYAHEIAQYYLEHWAPDYQLSIDCLVEGENHPLLTLQRFNPNQFRHESPSSTASLRQEAESPVTAGYSDVALPMCRVVEVGRERLVVWVNSAEDLALHVNIRELSPSSRERITIGSTISLWASRKVSRYDFYLRQVKLALPSLDVGAVSFKVGPLCVHNPLVHLSVPMLAATKPPAYTWTVPGHGDLHPGNVLMAGTLPVVIDYGKAVTEIPVGVDAARFYGGLVRDVLAEMFSFEELAMVIADSLGLGSFVKEDNSPASRAVHLLKLLVEKLVPDSAPDLHTLWPVHLYGYAWIGLKWPHSSPESYRACFLLAGMALQRLLGAATIEEEGRLATLGGGEEESVLPVTAARPVRLEGPAEILILVSRFDGTADYDPTIRIYSTLADHVFEIIPDLARVERIEEVVSSRKEAVAVAGRFRASMIVWGTFDNLGVSPHYEVTRDSLVVKRSMVQLDQATRHQLSERFEPYITQNLAAETTFLSLVAVARMCELNLNFDAAIKVYHRTLTLIPDRERARVLGAAGIYRSLAALHFTLNRDREAVDANDKARELDPNDLGTQLQQMQVRSRLEKKSEIHQIEEMKNLLRSRLEANVDKPEVLEALRVAITKVEPLHTSADFRRLLQSESEMRRSWFPTVTSNKFKKDVAVHLQRAQEFYHASKYAKGLAEVRSALRLNPRCAEAFWMRANILAYADRVEEALKDLDRAQKLNPKLYYIYNTRGAILNDADDYEGALRQFEKAFDLGMGKQMAMPYWGETMVELDRGEEAMQLVRDGEFDPSSPYFFVFRSHYYRKQREYNMALREADQAIQLPYDLPSSLKERAEVYTAMGRTDLAIMDLGQAIENAPVGSFIRRWLCDRLAELYSLSAKAKDGQRAAP